MSRIRDRRPTRSPSSQLSRALRTTAWRAALGVKPSSRSEPISASCHAPSGRGNRYSPRHRCAAGGPIGVEASSTSGDARDAAERRIVRRHDRLSLPVARWARATGGTWAPAGSGERARRNACTCGRVHTVRRHDGPRAGGGTVADVYTGTWIQANVEIADGVITYVGPREPDGAGRSTSPGRCWCPATSSRTPTRGACTRRRRCSRPRSPTARRRWSTTACSSFSPTASTGCAGSSTRCAPRPRTSTGPRGSRRSPPTPTRRPASRPT